MRCESVAWTTTLILMRGRSTAVCFPHFAQTVFDRNPGRGPLEKTLCAEVAPCQLATDVIGPHQYVGVESRPTARGNKASERCDTNTGTRVFQRSPNRIRSSRLPGANGDATKASVGSRLEFGGSAPIDRLWAQDSGSFLGVRDQHYSCDRLQGH